MGKITFVAQDGTRTDVEGVVGQSVMAIATKAKIPGIVGECGGCLSCATCHCYVAEDWAGKIAPPSDDEKMMVDCALDVRETSRLSCQITYAEDLDGIVIEVPASQY